MVQVGAALVSVLLDVRFGEPPTRVHPVVWMGQYLGLKERVLGVSSLPLPRLALGAAFALVGAGGCGILAWGLTRVLSPLPWPIELALTAADLLPITIAKMR